MNKFHWLQWLTELGMAERSVSAAGSHSKCSPGWCVLQSCDATYATYALRTEFEQAVEIHLEECAEMSELSSCFALTSIADGHTFAQIASGS